MSEVNLMTTPALITALRRLADIASSTDRAAVLSEAADRLAELAEDKARLDWIVSMRTMVTTAGPYPGVWFCHASQGATIRDVIDASMREGNRNG